MKTTMITILTYITNTILTYITSITSISHSRVLSIASRGCKVMKAPIKENPAGPWAASQNADATNILMTTALLREFSGSQLLPKIARRSLSTPT